MEISPFWTEVNGFLSAYAGAQVHEVSSRPFRSLLTPKPTQLKS